jgi:hypothetical protein
LTIREEREVKKRSDKKLEIEIDLDIFPIFED